MLGSKQDLKKYVCKIADKDGNVRGTGFFVLPEGNIATCHHVIEDLKGNVMVEIFGESEPIIGEIVRDYEMDDIAIVKINREKCPVLPISTEWKHGDRIFSHGFSIEHSLKEFPKGFPMKSVLSGTTTIESGRDMLVLEEIEVDSGLSGAPAVNEKGIVIGILRLKYQEGRKALVIPADYLLKKWAELEKYHESLKKSPELDIPLIQSVLRKGEISEGEFFRKEPTWMDFEQGFIVERKEVDKIIFQLERNKIQLILGEPASGKSIILKNVGYKLANWNQKVFFVELKKHLIENISKIEDKNSIFIVDDAHLFLSECEKLIRDFRTHGTGYLIIGSRNTREIPEGNPKEASEFEYLNKKAIHVRAEDVTEGMINAFLKVIYHLSDDRIKTVSDNLHKFKTDLWFLSWALKAFKIEKDVVDEKDFYEKIRDSIRKIRAREEFSSLNAENVFLPLSIFYRFEIPIERDFLEKQMGIEGEIINQLIEMSEIVETEEIGKSMMLSLYHSSIAELYFGAYQRYPSLGKEIKKKILKGKDEKYIVYLLFCQYITICDPKNSIDAMIYIGKDFLNKKGGITLLEQLIEEVKIQKSIEKGIEKEEDLSKIGESISTIFINNNEIGKKLVNRINMEILNTKIEKEPNIENIGWFLSTITKVNKELGMSLAKSINIENISKRIDKDDLRKYGWCLSGITQANEEVGMNLANLINLRILNTKIEKEEKFLNIGWYISIIWEANRDVGKKLINLINIDTFLSKIKDDNNSISSNGFFISIIAEMNKEMASKITDSVSSEIEKGEYLFCWNDIPGKDSCRFIEFLKSSFDIKSIETVEIKKFNDNIINAYFQNNYIQLKLNDRKTKVNCNKNNIGNNEFIAEMENDRLNIYKVENLGNIEYCVKNIVSDPRKINSMFIKSKNTLDIREVKNEMALKLVNSISSRIEKEDDILNIGFFISEICNANREVALKIVDRINKKTLIEIIENDEINLGICFALANFRWVSKIFYDEIISGLNPNLKQELKKLSNQLHPTFKKRFNNPIGLKIIGGNEKIFKDYDE